MTLNLPSKPVLLLKKLRKTIKMSNLYLQFEMTFSELRKTVEIFYLVFQVCIDVINRMHFGYFISKSPIMVKRYGYVLMLQLKLDHFT